jgi:hypothetical protein
MHGIIAHNQPIVELNGRLQGVCLIYCFQNPVKTPTEHWPTPQCLCHVLLFRAARWLRMGGFSPRQCPISMEHPPGRCNNQVIMH